MTKLILFFMSSPFLIRGYQNSRTKKVCVCDVFPCLTTTLVFHRLRPICSSNHDNEVLNSLFATVCMSAHTLFFALSSVQCICNAY